MWESAIGVFAIIRDGLEQGNSSRFRTKEERKNLADRLTDNCQKWSSLITETINQAVLRWDNSDGTGRLRAEAEIGVLIHDETKLNYSSLNYGPIYSKFEKPRNLSLLISQIAAKRFMIQL